MSTADKEATEVITKSAEKPIALTMGDPVGIGPEVIAKLFLEHPCEVEKCFVVGDVVHMQRAARLVSPTTPLPIIEIHNANDVLLIPPRSIPVLPIAKTRHVLEFGQVSAEAGTLAAQSVIWAAQSALRNEISAIVTAPLHKEALKAAGYTFPGHTELLQHEAALFTKSTLAKLPVRMMLANSVLKTVLLSIHVSLRNAIDAVTTENLKDTFQITHHALYRSLGRTPRIAVAGLNPHSGEGGHFGTEEIEIIAPAIRTARTAGLDIHGPFAPDTIFMRASQGEFDVVIAMYHDQGLIPVKLNGFSEGVNVTLGLPFIRTSPDHGTAFDIAGHNKANAASMLAALKVARSLICMSAETKTLV